MKKAVALLVCMVCLFCTFAGCKNSKIEPESTSKNINVKKTLIHQEDVLGMFKVEKCLIDTDDTGITIQLRNDSNKVMTSFRLLIQFFDEKNSIIAEECTMDDKPMFATPGELTHESGYDIKKYERAQRINVYVADVSYQDESEWLNKDLVLSEKSQLPVKMEKEISEIYSIEQCKMDITKLELQLKNLSQDKTISSYSLLVRYLDAVGNEEMYSTFKLDYDGAQIKPSEISERQVWGVSPWEYKVANCYVSEIVYSDGTKWNNPNIPAQESE